MKKIAFAAAATIALGAAALAPTTASAGGYGHDYGYKVYKPHYSYDVYVAPTPYVYIAPKKRYFNYYYGY